MKWLLDDKIKHRLIGFAVLLSIAIIFIPAMIKKSNQHLDEKMSLTIHLPPKPAFTEVSAEKPKNLFKTMKVAHVVLPQVVEKKEETIKIARAESLSGLTMANRSYLQKTPVVAVNTQRVNKQINKQKPAPIIASVKAPTKPLPSKLEMFSVQLASFSRLDNAQLLVQQLHKKGFKATYEKQGDKYRVLVGQLQLEQARNLQRKLASATQMTGFIVKIA